MQVKVMKSYSLIERNWRRVVVNHEKPDTIYPSSLVRVWLGPMIDDNALHKPILVLYE